MNYTLDYVEWLQNTFSVYQCCVREGRTDKALDHCEGDEEDEDDECEVVENRGARFHPDVEKAILMRKKREHICEFINNAYLDNIVITEYADAMREMVNHILGEVRKNYTEEKL